MCLSLWPPNQDTEYTTDESTDDSGMLISEHDMYRRLTHADTDT